MTTANTGRLSTGAPPIQLTLPLDLPPVMVYPPTSYAADTAGRARPTQIPAGTDEVEGVAR